MWINSFKMIFRQNWLTYVILGVIGIGGAWLTILLYPGEEGVWGLLAIAETPFGELFYTSLLINLDSQNSTFFLWFIFLFFIAYASNIYPFLGIWLGGAGTPEEANSGMGDLFIASSHRRWCLPLRHILTHLTLIVSITLLILINVLISLPLADKAVNFSRVLNGFILLVISFMIFYAISFFFSHLTLKSEIGRGIAVLIFLLSYVIRLMIGFNADFEFLDNINLLHYTNSSTVLIMGDPLIINNFLPLILAVILIISGIVIINFRDFIPSSIKLNIKFGSKFRLNLKTNPLGYLKRKFRFFDYIESFLGRISPISAEQWVADRNIILLFLVLCTFGVISVIVGYPTGEGGFENMAKVYTNNPIVTAIVRGSLDAILEDPLAPLYTQYYGYNWLYFFPLLILGANKIVNRDNNDKTLDLIYGTPITPRRIIFARIITVIFEVALLALLNVVVLIFGEIYLGIENKLIEQLASAILIPIAYGAILCLFIAISITIPNPSHRKKMILFLGSFSLVFVLFPYFQESLLPLRYLSPLYYLDLVGVIVDGFFGEPITLLLVLVIVLISSVIYLYIFSNKQVLT